MVWTTVVSHCAVGFRKLVEKGGGWMAFLPSRQRRGLYLFLTKVRQGGKISFHKIWNFTPLLNYDQSLSQKQSLACITPGIGSVFKDGFVCREYLDKS